MPAAAVYREDIRFAARTPRPIRNNSETQPPLGVSATRVEAGIAEIGQGPAGNYAHDDRLEQRETNSWAYT